MAVGWAGDGAVHEQIDATIQSEVSRVRSPLGTGESLEICKDCGERIPEARRRALPGVQRCLACQTQLDKVDVARSLYNRSGNKDSQLK